jgi:Thioredoxin-like domain
MGIPLLKSSVVLTMLRRMEGREKHQRKLSPQGHLRLSPMLTLTSIISYMTKQALPAVSTLTSDTLEEFKTQDKVVVVAYFAADDKTSNETFSKVADSMRDDFLFGATNDVALAEAAGVKQPGLVMYKDFDDRVVTFDKKFTTEAIEEFARTASVPLVGEIGPETYAGYMAVSHYEKGPHRIKADKLSRPVCL